jgi:molecular chaperone GrpE (heat shock protein)
MQKKIFLKNKIIEYLHEIVKLKQCLAEKEKQYFENNRELFLNLLEILDAFDNINETIETKKDSFNKTTFSLCRSFESIHKKLIRLLKENKICKIEFSDNKAHIDFCKIIETEERNDLEAETIISIIKNGYFDKKQNTILRKAEVITVINKL